mmetsp:Transcript_36731/g.111014  ORF Transcript_36731/g.111014 Transcript_36731/m.111014 type:complete len:236 (-) Transcript_36731:65-772(-)
MYRKRREEHLLHQRDPQRRRQLANSIDGLGIHSCFLVPEGTNKAKHRKAHLQRNRIHNEKVLERIILYGPDLAHAAYLGHPCRDGTDERREGDEPEQVDGHSESPLTPVRRIHIHACRRVLRQRPVETCEVLIRHVMSQQIRFPYPRRTQLVWGKSDGKPSASYHVRTNKHEHQRFRQLENHHGNLAGCQSFHEPGQRRHLRQPQQAYRPQGAGGLRRPENAAAAVRGSLAPLSR